MLYNLSEQLPDGLAEEKKMAWNHPKILGTAIFLSVLFVLALANLADAGEFEYSEKYGCQWRGTTTEPQPTRANLDQCSGAPTVPLRADKPFNILAWPSHAKQAKK